MRRAWRFGFGVCGLLWLAAGCAAVQVVKADPKVSAPQYTTLVVADFENAIGDALPPRVLQELPGAVIAHLHECYPGAFAQVRRASQCAAEELVIRGTVTEYQAGNRALRFLAGPYGAGRAKVAADVAFYDGQSGQQVMLAKGDWVFGAGGVVGAIGGIDDLVQSAGAGVADLIAEKRGATRSEAGPCAKYGQPVPAGR